MRYIVSLLLLCALLAGVAFAAEEAPAASSEEQGMEMPLGDIGFIEFGTTDLAASQSFYSSLFGWTFEAMPGMDTMAFFTTPGGKMGGITSEMAPSAEGVTLYINCDGVAAKLAEIEAAGGTTVMPAMQIPGGAFGYIAHFTDPQGNRHGLWSMAP
jgi:uncharacterized protein